MENATQALFMAAGVLIAVLIISFAVFLFSSASSVSENYDRTMSESDRLKFNAQFTKYATNDVPLSNDEGDGVLKYTSYNVASDVVSVVNLAYNLNESYDYDVQRGIQVKVMNINSSFSGSGSDTYGITPLVQKHYNNKKINDKNNIYRLKESKKEDFTDFSLYDESYLNHTNKLLENYSECAYYKSEKNDKLYKIYKYYFKGEVNLNEETGLVDEVVFTCIDNTTNYQKAFDQEKIDI